MSPFTLILFLELIRLSRMGFTTTRNQELHSGFQTYIGGKEIEFDCQIPQSQFPGLQREEDIGEAKLGMVKTPAKAIINVKSFYGTPQPKASGPLYVHSIRGNTAV